MTHMVELKNTLKKNTMFFALIVVMVLFQVMIVASDKGSLFNPLIFEILVRMPIIRSGMLLCILTGVN